MWGNGFGGGRPETTSSSARAGRGPSSGWRTCGKGAIMRMGADSPRVRVEVIPTGAINLDAAIGIGGIPRGRVTEIFGPESSGKTTLALHVVANAQRQGGAAAYIDAEHALDVEYAKKPGADIDRSEEHTSELQSPCNL